MAGYNLDSALAACQRAVSVGLNACGNLSARHSVCDEGVGAGMQRAIQALAKAGLP